MGSASSKSARSEVSKGTCPDERHRMSRFSRWLLDVWCQVSQVSGEVEKNTGKLSKVRVLLTRPACSSPAKPERMFEKQANNVRRIEKSKCLDQDPHWANKVPQQPGVK